MGTAPQSVDLDSKQVQALKDRLKTRSLKDEDYGLILALLETLLFIKVSLENKRNSIRRLVRMLFGAPTETPRNELPKKRDSEEHETAPSPSPTQRDPTPEEKTKPKGHGRNGADRFTGAQRIPVAHSDQRLKPGALCPLCGRAKLYELQPPARFVRIVGKPPLDAQILECERTRCALCGQVFTAPLPEGIDGQKYDASAGAMLVNLKYGSGVPFYRLEKLQESLGIPMPDSTQWDLVEQVADQIHRVFLELIGVGAQAKLVHNDDTSMKVLSLLKEIAQQESGRTGIFTTAVLCITDEGQKIALFFTGRCHAGENLGKVLKERSPEREPPIQMSDASSCNKPKGTATIEANCLYHARKNFVDVQGSFPDECAYLIEALAKVYHHESIINKKGLCDEQRLEYHQSHSGPIMDKLHRWGTEQLKERKVEPNSDLGRAIQYMFNHWKELTLFLRVPGAPLDNNMCEQVLKRAVLHRKNSLFYRTEHGAYIGDMFMSLIHTCSLGDVNPFDYITVLQIHSSEVNKNPGKWLPWNYQQNIDPQSR